MSKTDTLTKPFTGRPLSASELEILKRFPVAAFPAAPTEVEHQAARDMIAVVLDNWRIANPLGLRIAADYAGNTLPANMTTKQRRVLTDTQNSILATLQMRAVEQGVGALA